MGLAASLAVVSGLDYTIRGARMLRAAPRQERGI
jgi:hypothetical protein